MTDDPATRTEGEGQTLDMPEGMGGFVTGQVLGERYQILEMLGRGGMGEVWHAFDLKLRVEVALKALRPEFFKSERRLELLRQEVRAAREVVSPNVCRIFDLIEIEGRELVSMEYVDGATLLGVLTERGPLELKEAQDIASQFLAGLEAIHKSGLIHRDIKPENIMLTRAGRVVVMDFGLARQEEEGGGSVAGTPAYMAPEQAAGQKIDARADVYAAGVVLAEMVSPEGVKSYESRQSVWEGVRSEPARLPDSPWAPVIQRAVARDREHRQNSAHTLIRELEDVTLRVEGAEDLHPYPGLASFTEEDAEYFFGREAEVEQMWRKLEGPPRLFAIMGPSGAGKTSFIRAGLAPNAPPGWTILRCTPGNSAIASLRGSLSGELTRQPELLQALLTDPDNPDVIVEAVAGWRQGSTRALVIVDQFEELFTLNARQDQDRFASLLGRLPLEDNVHVLLSMRDDFAATCNEHRALEPVFHELTVLNPPTGGNLRRALVQPATNCGYRFEDDELVEEMLAEIEGERGALPTIAFAAARLWENRNRDTGLLTREAYHDIGGVGGALAQHAEATIDRIGSDRIAIVRELFRNLVTAEGTRAVREWDELLSIFDSGDVSREGINPSPTKDGAAAKQNVGAGVTPAREAAEEVLRELIDARLLTSYEVKEEDREPTRRIEIIHESLLANWPRLVRWQTQDQEGAQLRDELRQAARAWDEHGRHDDRLWTGTAFREYQLWRERYSGGLTETEEAFATAITSLATRRRRRRRLAVAAAFVALLIILGVVGGFWRRSVQETQRAEAASLIALGQVEIDSYPSASVAYAIASLELEDTSTARMMALEALWKGPTAFVVNEYSSGGNAFSPNGNWVWQNAGEGYFVHSRDGKQMFVENSLGALTIFGESEDHFFAFDARREFVSLRSAHDGRVLASTRLHADNPGSVLRSAAVVGKGSHVRAIFAAYEGGLVSIESLTSDGLHDVLGTIPVDTPDIGVPCLCTPRVSGDWVAVVGRNEVSVVDISEDGISDSRLLGRQDNSTRGCLADPRGRFFVTTNAAHQIMLWDPEGNHAPTTVDAKDPQYLWPFSLSIDGSLLYSVSSMNPTTTSSEIRVWSVDGLSLHLLRRLVNVREMIYPIIDPVGLRLAMSGPEPVTRLWSLRAPPEAEPTLLRRGLVVNQKTPRFSPDGKWMATTDGGGLTMWPMARKLPIVIRQETFGTPFRTRRVASDGSFFLTVRGNKVFRLRLDRDDPSAGRTVFEDEEGASPFILHLARDDRHLAVIDGAGNNWIVDLENGEARRAPTNTDYIVFSLDGRYLAEIEEGLGGPLGSSIVVRDLDNGREVASLHLDDVPYVFCPQFTTDGRILVSIDAGVLSWNPATGSHELLVETEWNPWFDATDDGRRLVVVELDESRLFNEPAKCPVYYNLESGQKIPLEFHGRPGVQGIRLDETGENVVTAGTDGVIRVVPVTGEEPHLLLGHQRSLSYFGIDREGQWIISQEEKNGTIHLWPMPDLSKPPLHTLPREELIAKLKTLTNLRVARDPESSTGWKLTHDPFPGWETVPEW